MITFLASPCANRGPRRESRPRAGAPRPSAGPAISRRRDDRAGDRAREQRHEEQDVERVAARGDVAAVDVHGVRDLLEGEERDADRQRDREQLGRPEADVSTAPRSSRARRRTRTCSRRGCRGSSAMEADQQPPRPAHVARRPIDLDQPGQGPVRQGRARPRPGRSRPRPRRRRRRSPRSARRCAPHGRGRTKYTPTTHGRNRNRNVVDEKTTGRPESRGTVVHRPDATALADGVPTHRHGRGGTARTAI